MKENSSQQLHMLRYTLTEQLIHGMEVSNLAYDLARELGYEKEICYELAKAGVLHDIGKIVLENYVEEQDTLVVEEMRSLKSEYGVLPLPKYDETQKEYYTVVDGGANIMFVPITTNEKQREIVGAIVESMSALSYRDVIPTYCGMALEQKGTRDEESIAMLRKILDSRVIDFAYLYDGFSGWAMKLPSLVLDSSSISSKIAKDETAVEKYYNDVVTYLTENAE